MTNPVSSYSYKQAFVQTIAKHRWACAITGIAALALLAIYSNRRHSVHQIGTDQGYFRKTYLTVKERLWGLTNCEVYELLLLISAQAPDQSDKPFSLGMGKYIAYMPAEYRWKSFGGGGLPKSLKPFQEQVIEPSTAKVVVNLIYGGSEKEDYLNKSCHSEELSTASYGVFGAKYESLQSANTQTKKTYLQITDSPHGAFMNLAGYVAKNYSNDELIFVHCIDGRQSTAAFISWIEYMRRHERLNTVSNPALLRQEMISILKEVAKTARGRVPYEYDMQSLLNPPKY